jgi:hypothetical protein
MLDVAVSRNFHWWHFCSRNFYLEPYSPILVAEPPGSRNPTPPPPEV